MPPLRSLQELQEAACQGAPTAADRLGQMYSTGQGVPQDYVTAYAWPILAADRGDKDAAEARSDLR